MKYTRERGTDTEAHQLPRYFEDSRQVKRTKKPLFHRVNCE